MKIGEEKALDIELVHILHEKYHLHVLSRDSGVHNHTSAHTHTPRIEHWSTTTRRHNTLNGVENEHNICLINLLSHETWHLNNRLIRTFWIVAFFSFSFFSLSCHTKQTRSNYIFTLSKLVSLNLIFYLARATLFCFCFFFVCCLVLLLLNFPPEKIERSK